MAPHHKLSSIGQRTFNVAVLSAWNSWQIT